MTRKFVAMFSLWVNRGEESMKNAVRVGAMIAAVVLFAMVIYLVLIGADGTKYITLSVLFAFAVLATRLDDITNLNFGATGVQAALEKKLQEAQATVTQLQRVAELFGQISVLQISMSNRWDGLSSRAKREAIDKIAGELRAINIPEDRINALLVPQTTYDRLDYYYWLTRAIPSQPTQEQLEGFTLIQTEFANASYNSVPAIADVEEYLRKNNMLSGEALERLKDWKQYERDHTHRRIEAWDRRNEQAAA